MTVFPINFVDPSAHVGLGSTIWHYSVVLADVRIGNNCSVGSGSEIGRGSIIGDQSRIGAHVFLPPNSRIGSWVFIGPNVVCTDDRLPSIHQPGEPPYIAEPPVIEDHAAIGAGAILLPGVKIGHHARIGAGAIVTKDVEPFAHVRGEPAREHVLSEASRSW